MYGSVYIYKGKLNKEDIKNIGDGFKHLKCKVIEGEEKGIVRLEFPIYEAHKITMDEFVNVLEKATKKKVTGGVIKNRVCFKFD